MPLGQLARQLQPLLPDNFQDIIFLSGLPMPVNDVIVVRDSIVLPPNQIGEIWM